jgi:hypothetical protein
MCDFNRSRYGESYARAIRMSSTCTTGVVYRSEISALIPETTSRSVFHQFERELGLPLRNKFHSQVYIRQNNSLVKYYGRISSFRCGYQRTTKLAYLREKWVDDK